LITDSIIRLIQNLIYLTTCR